MHCGKGLLWLVAVLLALLMACYLLFPVVWESLILAYAEHRHLVQQQWQRHRRGGGGWQRQPQMVENGGAAEETEDAPPPDVLDYTPDNATRVRIFHPQTPEALEFLLAEGRTDPKIVRQVVVTSSSQYPDVSAETPMVITTYAAT